MAQGTATPAVVVVPADLGAGDPVPDDLADQLRAVATALVDEWRARPPAALRATCVEGGITNKLFRLQDASSPAGTCVVVRVNGLETERVVARDRERDASALLPAYGFGKRVYGEFGNGRVEEWLSGRALQCQELARDDVMADVARRLAALHRVQIRSPRFDPHRATIWDTVDRYMDEADRVTFDDATLGRLDRVAWRNVGQRLRHLVAQTSPVVLAHNDLLAGNIILDESPGARHRIQFIDFEYAAYNSRAFDIANHWCEFAGFDCDWGKFPGPAQQARFARYYLGDGATDDDVRALVDEVRPWPLVSHLVWAFWGIVQARVSAIDFDFIGYARQRFQGFHHYLRTAVPHLAPALLDDVDGDGLAQPVL